MKEQPPKKIKASLKPMKPKRVEGIREACLRTPMVFVNKNEDGSLGDDVLSMFYLESMGGMDENKGVPDTLKFYYETHKGRAQLIYKLQIPEQQKKKEKISKAETGN